MLPPTPKRKEPARDAIARRGGAARPRRASIDPKRVAFFILLALLLFGSYEVFRPFAASLVLAAWAAHLIRPVFLRLSRAFHGRPMAAGVLTTALLLLVIAPIALAVTTLVPAASQLFDQLRAATGGRGVLSALVTGNGAPSGKLDIVGLAKDYGASASKVLGIVAGASLDVIVATFVFFAAFFGLLVEGERAYAWVEERGPFGRDVTRRLKDAFHQAGRGLLVGNGLTALAQGALAGVIYAALGVPRAVLLGLLTVIGALIPFTGPPIVWLPVAAGLAFTGHPVKAAILAALGIAVVGTVDNLMRPWLSRRAHAGLSTVLLLVAIFGGMAAFGPWGLLLGPVVVRLAKEALEIARDRDLFSKRTEPSSGTA